MMAIFGARRNAHSFFAKDSATKMAAYSLLDGEANSAALPPRIVRKAAPPVGTELFQRNLAHGFVAHDFADFQTLDRQLALLVFGTDHFSADRVCLFAETIQCGHVGIFDHKQNIVVLLSRSIYCQDFIIGNDTLPFLFSIGLFDYLG